MGRSTRGEPQDADYFKLPLERSGATWRFVLAGAIFGLLLLSLFPKGKSSHDNPDEWTPLLWFFLSPHAVVLLVSGLGIRRGWEPNVLFRLLPLLAVLGMIVFGFAVGGC